MESETREDEDEPLPNLHSAHTVQSEKHYTSLSQASVTAKSISTITDYILISLDAIGAHRFSSLL
jgi:hypothetical protein